MGDSESPHQHTSAVRSPRDVGKFNGFGQITSPESSGSQLQHMPAGRLSRGIEETHGFAQTQPDLDQMPRPSKRRRGNLPSDNQIESESKGKRKLASGISDDKSEKRARVPTSFPDAGSIDFQEIQNPPKVCCLLQVNFGELVGSLTTSHGGYGIWLYLNGGKERSPNIGLVFKVPGSDGSEVGRVNWYFDSRAEDRWVIQDFHYRLVAEAPHQKLVSNKKAIEKCESAESLARLMFTLKLTSHAGGSCARPHRNSPQAIKACLHAIFWQQKDYELRIWFVIPRKSLVDIDAHCLRVMLYLFSIRQEPFAHARDRNGMSFEHLIDDANRSSVAATHQKSAPEEAPQTKDEAGDVVGEEEAEGVAVKAEPKETTLWDTPAFNEDTQSVQTYPVPEQTQSVHYQRRLPSPAVPSFGFSRPPRPAYANAPSSNDAKFPPAIGSGVTPVSTLAPGPYPPRGHATAIAAHGGRKEDEAEEGEIKDD